MTTSSSAGRDSAEENSVIHLSKLLRAPVVARSGEAVGRVEDVIVRLTHDAYPPVTGIVAGVGRRRVFVDGRAIHDYRADRIVLATNEIDLRSFERREGEVLLRADVLGHRLIDVAAAELVHAYDVELENTGHGWVPARLDIRGRPRLFGLLKPAGGPAARDWRAFEPLIGHHRSIAVRRAAGRVGALRPAQIADLIEAADTAEGGEILDRVRSNPELEADVFEELDSEKANRLLAVMTDADVAGLLGRMRADDAADAIVDLRQSRRARVLALMPAPQRTKVTTLMGFNPSSAGGLMNTDTVSCAADVTVADALAAVAAARGLQPEALLKVHVVAEQGRLVGVISVITLIQAKSTEAVATLMDSDPVRVTADTDLTDVALLMADFNLYLVPVVDDGDRVLGVVTVDDVLEATIPDGWRPPRAGVPARSRNRGGAVKATDPSGRTAVLDSAHIGDIEGAFGRVKVNDPDRARTVKVRLATMLAIIGPGLIVMVGDNDAGGVSTYAQAGQNYGYSLLWVLLLLIPVLIVNQEMVVRLGAVTGVGHARLINERFGRGWGWFSVGDLFVLNFLTIVTEFIGITLAADYFGISRYVVVPTAAVALVVIMASGSFRRWERAMFVFIAITVLQVPMLLLAHPDWSRAAGDFVIPGITGGVSSDAVLLIIAIVGTTVAPWQLFFQQSNIVDKRITPRFIGYERADTVLGAFVVVLGAAALVMTGDWAARATDSQGAFTDAGAVAHLLGQDDHLLGSLFAIVLLDASIVGAAAVTLATSYAFGDVFGLKHSLHRGFSDAKQFYLSYTAMVVVAAAIVLIPGAPLGIITTAVQALAGLLLPSASVFLLLLCNDREVLGPWVNRRWLNIVAGVIVGILLVLSGVLMATTLFPDLDVIATAGYLSVGMIAFAGVAMILLRLTARRSKEPSVLQPTGPVDRTVWRMPPLTLLQPVTWSPATRLGMLALRGYLVIGAILLIVKAYQLSKG